MPQIYPLRVKKKQTKGRFERERERERASEKSFLKKRDVWPWMQTLIDTKAGIYCCCKRRRDNDLGLSCFAATVSDLISEAIIKTRKVERTAHGFDFHYGPTIAFRHHSWISMPPALIRSQSTAHRYPTSLPRREHYRIPRLQSGRDCFKRHMIEQTDSPPTLQSLAQVKPWWMRVWSLSCHQLEGRVWFNGKPIEHMQQTGWIGHTHNASSSKLYFDRRCVMFALFICLFVRLLSTCRHAAIWTSQEDFVVRCCCLLLYVLVRSYQGTHYFTHAKDIFHVFKPTMLLQNDI